jgi:CRP-like cAMP-binding protein
MDQLYFPDEALVAYFAGTAEGETIGVSIIGNEGVVGIESLFSEAAAFRAVVQIPGLAYCMSKDFLRREFKRSDTLHRILLHYTNAMLIQMAQTAVCTKFHSTRQRFCRWLLMAQDRSSAADLPFTQDEVARVLGSRRASVSVVAAQFQNAGAIQYNRGVIRIIDRRALKESSCECYETISAAHHG